ncbi:tail fiber domain-containing protein [Bdellovibrio sp. BCCA]|uniref:tail fiber domain-containing protein n=1 Tax=Bdellovibrio sp. BCCA TaxID=3136281 RepID=UPI0030EFB68C
MYVTAFFAIAFTAIFSFHSSAYASPGSLTYQGRILDSSGSPLEYEAVQFQFEITNPTGTCVLYREVSQVNDMRNSNGVFDIPIGTGTKSFPASPTFTLLEAFDNTKTFNCAAGGTYTSADGDKRKLRVQFKDAVGWKLISPDSDIRSVPYAAYSKVAQQLGDKTSNDFVLKTSLTTCGANQYLTFDGTNFVCQNDAGASGVVTNVTGTSPVTVTMSGSTAQVSVSVGTTASTLAAGNDSRITGAFQSATALGGDLSGTLPSPSVVKIQGKTISATTPNDGEFLKYNSGSWTPSALAVSDVSNLQTTLDGKVAKSSLVTCDSSQQTLSYNIATGVFTCRNIDDSAKLPLAGGTMTGAIEMSNNNLTNVGYVTMAAGKSLHLSNNSSDPSGLATADKGKVWYNSTTNEVKYWDGSSAKTLGVAGSGLQSFNGQTGNAQTLATPGSAGTAPNWNSAGDAHTLNIPMASGAGVTAGLINKTDYDNFNNKQSSALADGKVWIGSSSNVATAVTLSGDVTITNAGISTVGKIQTKPIVITTLASGELLKYDGTNWINVALGISDISGLSTQLSNKINAGQMPANCASGQTLTFSSPSGSWVCSNISISDTQITYTSKTANTFLAAPNGSAGAPTFRTIAAADLPANAYDSTYFKNGGNSFGGSATLGTNDNNSLAFKTNNSTQVTIDPSGNVGVGIASPTAKLEVNETSGATIDLLSVNDVDSVRKIRVTKDAQIIAESAAGSNNAIRSRVSGDANDRLAISGAGRVSFGDGTNPPDTYIERLSSGSGVSVMGGNVGIGTSLPESKLHVLGTGWADSSIYATRYGNHNSGSGIWGVKNRGATSSTYSPVLSGDTIVTFGGSGIVDTAGTGVSAGNIAIVTDSDWSTGVTPSSIVFKVNDGNDVSALTERMRISSSGNVGVGTSSPSVSLDIGSKTDALRLPNGTTAQQPGAPLNGMLRYNTTTNLPEVYQNGAWVSLTTSAGGSNITTNSSGAVTVAAGGTNQNVTLQASGTGVVTSPSVMTLTSGQASTASNNGALVVSGGVGVSGNINADGNIYSSGSISSGTSIYSPIIYGGAAASGNLTLDSTSDVTKGKVIIAPSGGNVGIGTNNPGYLLDLYQAVNGTVSVHVKNDDAGASGDTRYILDNGTISGGLQLRGTGHTTAPNTLNLYNGGANPITIYTNGAERMRIDGTGKVGIGTTAPTAPLQVSAGIGQSGIWSNSTALPTAAGQRMGVLGFGADTETSKGQARIEGFASKAWTSNSDTPAYLSFSTTPDGATAYVERMRINPDGNVGIGTTSPSVRLHVAGTQYPALMVETNNTAGAGDSQISLKGSRSGGGNNLAYINVVNNASGGDISVARVRFIAESSTDDGRIDFDTKPTGGGLSTRMTIRSSGYVGIGTASPAGPLDVQGGTNASGAGSAINLIGQNAAAGTSNVGGNIVLTAGNAVAAATSKTGGNVLITGGVGAFFSGSPILSRGGGVTITGGTGASSGQGGAASLTGGNGGATLGAGGAATVAGGAGSGAYQGGAVSLVGGAGGATDANGGNAIINGGAPGGAGAYGNVVIASSGGNVGIGTTAPSEKLHVVGNLRVQGSTDCTLGGGSGATNCTSDRRLKTNIKEIPNALAKILSLRGVEFDWNEKALSPGRHDIGVIAQEVEKVFPTTVIENPDSGYKMVDYAALVSPLIQSTKELYGMCRASERQMLDLSLKIDRNTRDIASLRIDNFQLKKGQQVLEKENAELKKTVEMMKQENAEFKLRLERMEKSLK